MNYIYDLQLGWSQPSSKDSVFSPATVDQDVANAGYLINTTFYTNFYTVKVFEGAVGQVKYPWVLSVKSAKNSFVIHTANFPSFLDCCAKLLISDVAA